METTAAKPPVPTELSLWQACQHGDLLRVRELISTGANLATDKDKENVTALHWAAINNHVTIAQYLLDNGAQVDATGGDLVSTALQWAVRQGHDLMIHTLTKAGASLNVRDAQNFTALHLAAQYGHPTTIIYLLCQGSDVNIMDNDRRTPLMWALYKGYSDEVIECFLRFNADIDHKDVIGCTAMHWGALQGNIAGCRALIKAGARLDIADDKGQSPLMCAEQKGHGHLFKKMLNESGPKPASSFLTKSRRMTYLALLPFISIGLANYAFVHLDWPFFLVSAIAIIFCTTQIAEFIRGDTAFIHTPTLAGFFQASVFWCFLCYGLVVLPATPDFPLLNAFIIFNVVVAEYLCYYVVTGNPGFLARGSIESTRAIVLDLVELNKFDSRNFCTTCLIRKPIRSKHDRVSDKCVARFDHYCPWVNNVVGYGNHRSFVIYLTCAILAQYLYFGLAIYYVLYNTDETHEPTNSYCFMSSNICRYFDLHANVIFTAFWCAFNGLWEAGTLGSQYYTILTNMTSNEMINKGRYDYLRHQQHDGHSHAASPFDSGYIRNIINFFSDGGSTTEARPGNLPNYYELFDVPKCDPHEAGGKHV